MGRILQQIHNRSRREYGYDAAGQLTHIQSRGGQTQYRYDPIGRLIAAVTPDFSETFAFDPAGNRLDLSGNKQDNTGQTSSQEKPSLNKVWGNLLKEYAGVHYDYDQRGNLVRKTRNGETTDYHWQEDTLAIESTNGQNTHYLFEPGTFEPLAQFQTASPIGIEREDKPAEPYSYDPETDPLLKIPPEPQRQSEAQPDLVYYQLDHLGTPIAAHNAKGEAVWTAEYEAWGRIRNETVSDGLKVNIPFRFQGQYYDEESGLHYNRFRYYDPEIGRFVSQDPIGFAGSDNFYEYAPNPIGWVDPLGLKKYCGLVYRALTQPQALEAAQQKDLSPKSRNNPHTVQEHVENWRNRTQFISTSRSLARAQFYAKSQNAKLVEIDLCKIHDSKIIDISNGQGLVNKGRQRARDWAIKDQEILIRGSVPSVSYRLIN